ncbi:MAG: hypothetical protein BWY83_01751 [bacterium ADurb.Bin478]|nr:MAG: hypothetical protein BWY83_01751 [bacterium ADurb.Bin478]
MRTRCCHRYHGPLSTRMRMSYSPDNPEPSPSLPAFTPFQLISNSGLMLTTGDSARLPCGAVPSTPRCRVSTAVCPALSEKRTGTECRPSFKPVIGTAAVSQRRLPAADTA